MIILSVPILVLDQSQYIELRPDQTLKLILFNTQRARQEIQAANAARNVLLDAKFGVILLACKGLEFSNGVRAVGTRAGFWAGMEEAKVVRVILIR